MLAANTLMIDVKKKENHKNTRLIFPGVIPIAIGMAAVEEKGMIPVNNTLR